MFRSGFVSIIGKPNVGKSTLLNNMIGQKLSIVTSRPQTTRNRILGVKNLKNAQLVFIDTPGIHKPKHKLGEIIVKDAVNSIKEVDIIFFVVNPEHPMNSDLPIIEILKETNNTTFLVINKIDLTKKRNLLPFIKEFSDMFMFNEVFPISAVKGDGMNHLLYKTVTYLPEGPKYYPDEIVTDQLERFMVSEIIREKIMNHTLHEIPHATAVEVIDWKERKDGFLCLCANIYIEKDSQKGIIIGKRGVMLKTIGTEARNEIERMLNIRVYLELFVKVKKNWRKNPYALRELGFH